MKTLEELQAMNNTELVDYVISLQKKTEKLCEKTDYWYKNFLNESARFTSFRNSVKSVVELVELPKSVEHE